LYYSEYVVFAESDASAPFHIALDENAEHWVSRTLSVLPPFVGGRLINRSLRFAGARIDKSVHFWGPPKVIGDLAKYLQIDEHTGFNARCLFELGAELVIEGHVAVGHEVEFHATRPIRIGSGAWLGARVIVDPGVTIGPGAVIGAGTRVSSDVPANVMVSGSRKVSLARWRA
jgi:acetyltransferase-like isoleucine patch superfamily enzyme